MGRVREGIDDALARFLEAQPVFFVATAPLSPTGRVNCSPKGNRGEFAVLGPRLVAYLDRTGSGIETVAHLRENGRIVLMFCAFSGPPRVVRLHGTGSVTGAGDSRLEELLSSFAADPSPGTRCVIVVSVERISDSCGFGVPLMTFEQHRPTLDEWAARKGPAGIERYWQDHNARSIDGLPGLS
ncbi:MAG TPA: pyridoxamine 5'-phosphate oxidase family protein [Acidimicrobiales bacterium]|nr:pyridoxamine 5'-phosphate oxidase family protein [Acidimicrobiales bacterium]